MKTKFLFIIQVVLLHFFYCQTGNLDTSFGNNGIVITDVSNLKNDAGSSVLVKDNGAILVTGTTVNNDDNIDIVLIQYNSNGELDNSFGSNGIVTLDINGFDDIGLSSVQQSDGKIVTVGYRNNTNKDIIIVRFNSNGTIDTSYATNGIYIYNNGANESAETVDILADDKIVVGCNISDDYGVIKLTNSGVLDTTFGTNGIVITNLGGVDSIKDIKLQTDGKILITGVSSKNDSGDGDVYDKALIRYTANGSLDNSFNSTGIIFTTFENGGDDGGYSILTQPDGKIIVSGSSNINGNDDNFVLARYNNDGSVDTTFGNNGSTITNFGSSFDLCFSSLLQNDGKIILGGYIINTTTFNYDFGLVRFNSNGVLDNTFGNNGYTVTDLNNGSKDFGLSLAFHEDNKILMAGLTRDNGEDSNIALARYANNDNLNTEDITYNSNDYLIYPNPSKENITILNNTKFNEKVNIEIFSITGKKLKTINNYYLNNKEKIELSNLEKGLYLVKISNKNKSELLKFIKN